MTQIQPPEPLDDSHELDTFDSGNPQLNHWLKSKATKNESSGASRTFVVTFNQQVIGFYCLAAGAIDHQEAPGKVKRNMPNPIPVIVIGRLAVDLNWQNQGIGSGLLKHAILKSIEVSQQLGVRAILVHALDQAAYEFYLKRGFIASPVSPYTLMITLKDAINAI